MLRHSNWARVETAHTFGSVAGEDVDLVLKRWVGLQRMYSTPTHGRLPSSPAGVLASCPHSLPVEADTAGCGQSSADNLTPLPQKGWMLGAPQAFLGSVGRHPAARMV